VASEFLKSGLSINDIDMRAAVVYVASTCTRSELRKDHIDHLIPTRLHRKGAKPGVRTKELAGGMQGSKEAKDTMRMMKEKADKLPPGTTRDSNPSHEDTKWTTTSTVPTKQEERLITAKVLEVAVRMILRHHIYKFGNKFYRQRTGGPMGLKLMGIVARIVMDIWARTLQTKLAESLITLEMLVKYVDDINLATRPIPKGMS
jgi:hypothetical protein